MYDLKIRNFILSHDNWEELLQLPPYNLQISRDDEYIMFKYSQIDSDFTEPIVQEARGIIFREKDWKCVCHAFNKFGNYGESYVEELDWNSVVVLEKIDGSLIKLFYDGEWRIATNGVIDAFKAELEDMPYPTFGDLLLNTFSDAWDLFCEKLDKNRTYMFELVSPYNRVVIPHENTELYYLGERDMATGKEYFLPANWDKSPKVFKLNNLQDVINAADQLPWDKEGYVCIDKDFRRCKIKSPKYVRAHFIRNNHVITRKRLLNIILKGEAKEFCIYADEYEDAIDGLVQMMAEIWVEADAIQCAFNMFHLKELSRKDYAKEVLQRPKIFQDFLFKNYDNEIDWHEYTSNWDANKWDKILEQCEQYKINKREEIVNE